jgi:hypothetical protein
MNKSQKVQHILDLISSYTYHCYNDDLDKINESYKTLEKELKTLVNQNYASRKALRSCKASGVGTRFNEMSYDEDYVKKALKLFGEEYKGGDE